jgi:nucleoside phosphorylase
MFEMEISSLCVMFALARESGPFVRSFRSRKRIENSPFRVWLCHRQEFAVVIAVSGVGREQTDAAVSWLLTNPQLDNHTYEPSGFVSAGFAGGLRDGITVATVIAANEIVDADGNRRPTSIMPSVVSSSFVVGRVLSSDQLVSAAAVKRELGLRHGAMAVDMESAVIAKRCESARVPFGCIRAISDDVNTELSPALASILAGGRVSFRRAAIALLRHPSLAGEFWRLARDSRRAAEALCVALQTLSD